MSALRRESLPLPKASPAFANDSYLIASQSADGGERMVKEYRRHFAEGCSKALSCQSVCPAGIETISSIMRMNRKKTGEPCDERFYLCDRKSHPGQKDDAVYSAPSFLCARGQ